MLKKKTPFKEISELTGLSEQEVYNLQKSL